MGIWIRVRAGWQRSVNLLPKSLVGRNALFVTVILILNNVLWFGLVRPAFFNRFVDPEQVYHPEGILRLYVDVEWAVFALVVCTLGAYVIFFWLRRQLQSVVSAARILGKGQTPQPIAETGPEEIRELSRGFNQLVHNLDSLDADRRFMLAGISHDLSTPLTRLRLAVELMQMKGDVNQVDEMIQDIEEMNAILMQFTDFVKSGKDEDPALGDFNQIVADICQRYIATGKAVHLETGFVPTFNFRTLAIRRLVTNLIENAARYSTGMIEVTTRSAEGSIFLHVGDRGPGIWMDPQNLIKPFVRENAARGSQAGAGLGLSIVDRIASIHGGELSLANRDGGGLVVTVALPIR